MFEDTSEISGSDYVYCAATVCLTKGSAQIFDIQAKVKCYP